MRARAYAKLNLGLKVLGKLDNGYHDLTMVNIPIDLYDVVSLSPSDRLLVTMDKDYLPINEKNTVIKAIRSMDQAYGIGTNYRVHVIKNIPTQAGLGGGSADAACVINMLNDLHQLNLSDQEKIDRAVEVGADVPFCLFNRPALVQGIGDRLTFLSGHPNFFILIVKPKQGISTGRLFERLVMDYQPKKQLDLLQQAFEEENYAQLLQGMANDLESSAQSQVKKLTYLSQRLRKLGFDRVQMSGAGSVFFGVTLDESLCDRVVVTLLKDYPLVKKCQMVVQGPFYID